MVVYSARLGIVQDWAGKKMGKISQEQQSRAKNEWNRAWLFYLKLDKGTSIIQSLNAVSYYKVGQDDFTPSNDAQTYDFLLTSVQILYLIP